VSKIREMPWVCYGCGKWVVALKTWWSGNDEGLCQYCPHCVAAVKDSYRLQEYQGHA